MNLKRFWSRPEEFSFKDLLAASFCGVFLYFSYRALNNSQALELVKVLVPLIGVILGGYFFQESAAMCFYRSQGGQQQYPRVYYGSYYMPLETPLETPVTPATSSPTAPPDIAPEPVVNKED